MTRFPNNFPIGNNQSGRRLTDVSEFISNLLGEPDESQSSYDSYSESNISFNPLDSFGADAINTEEDDDNDFRKKLGRFSKPQEESSPLSSIQELMQMMQMMMQLMASIGGQPLNPFGQNKGNSSSGGQNGKPSGGKKANAHTPEITHKGIDKAEGVTSTDAPTEQPANSVNIKDFGAVGDGKADDQAAIQKAIDSAKAEGKSVWIPEGTFNHSGTLTLDGVKMEGAGDNTVLQATDPHHGAIKLTGDGSELAHIKTKVNAPDRSSQPDAAAVLVQNANGAKVHNVTAEGASSNGIRLDNAQNSEISNNLVLGSNADGIALMNGSSHNKVHNNVVNQAGDDSFSDNSYLGDHRQNEGNSFTNNMSLNNAHGRGMCFAGSKGTIAEGNTIVGSKWYGIYADTDPNSDTMQSSGHRIANNTFVNNDLGDLVSSGGGAASSTGNTRSNDTPSIEEILGWGSNSLLKDRYSITGYTPGTGAGANNTSGNRT